MRSIQFLAVISEGLGAQGLKTDALRNERMMRSVSMSSPRRAKARPLTLVIAPWGKGPVWVMAAVERS